MITRVVTIEGVADPLSPTRRLGKDFGEGLRFATTVYGIAMAGGKGRAVMVPWSNIAFTEITPEAARDLFPEPIAPERIAYAVSYAEAVTKDLPLPVKAAPPPQFEKRGPGRPKK